MAPTKLVRTGATLTIRTGPVHEDILFLEATSWRGCIIRGYRMARQITLRQIEAFKAVVDLGTISRGAEAMNLSQPAMSKIITHLEEDTGLRLFDRIKGRLAPTEQAMQLYGEVDRIFAGIRQVQNAVDVIRREGQGRLTIGVLPALSMHFIEQAVSGYLRSQPGTLCTIHSLSSPWIVERLVSGKLDVGILGTNIENPHVVLEPLAEQPVVCIMTKGHPLSQKSTISPKDLESVPFISFTPEGRTGDRVAQMFESHGIEPNTVVRASMAPTVCQFVASGHGVSLVHPLMVTGIADQLAIRRFEPQILDEFQICYRAEGRSTPYVKLFIQEMRATAEALSAPIRAACDA